MSQYRIKAPLAALLNQRGGIKRSVMIPAGAVLHESSKHTTTLAGMVGLYWEKRHYSVCVNELLKNSERVQNCLEKMSTQSRHFAEDRPTDSRYRLKSSIPAIRTSQGRLISVMLPAGALLIESSQSSGPLIGMIHLYWQGCHYSVHPIDLLKNGEHIQSG